MMNAARIANWLFSGAVNGAILWSAASAENNNFVVTVAMGVVGYAANIIARRVYVRVVKPASASANSKMGLLEVSSWNRTIIWGLVNGLIYFLLYPFVAFNMWAAIALGIFTVSIRDVIIEIIKSYKPQFSGLASIKIPKPSLPTKDKEPRKGRMKPESDEE